MTSPACWLQLGGALLAALLAADAAEADPKRITGKLSKPGYTVIALDRDGGVAVARAGPKFKLTPTANRVTLHLRARNGTYAGPIVAARKRKGKRAIVGLRAGAKLGAVKVKRRKGFAKVERTLREKWVDANRTARAKKGVPRGAGTFGRVRSRASGAFGPGRDQDLDGIPGTLDVDDDGDLILDDLDPQKGAGARAAQTQEIFGVQARLPLPFQNSVNVNGGSADAEIDAVLPAFAELLVQVMPGDSAELDCGGSPNPAKPPPLVGGLPYCSWGGTGRVHPFSGPITAFPDCCDADEDGFGSLVGRPPPPGGMETYESLLPGATAAQIGTGNVLIERVQRGGTEVKFTTALQFAFATVPALASYSDTAGNSGTVSYPIAAGGPGTDGNGFHVAAGSDGDVVITLELWRPQRRPIPNEAGAWIDVGGLIYGFIANNVGGPGGTPVNRPCPQSALSTSDPSLVAGGPAGNPGFTDQAPDQPANAANRLTFTVNMTDCLAAAGADWPVGAEASISLSAILAPAGQIFTGAGQSVAFTRQ